MDIVTPAVTGAAGALVKEVATKAPEWLIDLIQASSPRLQQRAIENMEKLVVRLARRVELLETELQLHSRAYFKTP